MRLLSNKRKCIGLLYETRVQQVVGNYLEKLMKTRSLFF